MLYRNTDDPENPHGGPMWVAGSALKKMKPELGWIGTGLAILYSFTVMVSSGTGGNMFQAWNVADVTNQYFGLAGWISGAILTIIVAAVLIGGIKRIGKVAGTIVPGMVLIYVVAGFYVLFANFGQIPEMLGLIVTSAFTSTEATGAFVGGTVGSAFLFGMKRAIFSNEAGQGSSAIAHAAAKTDEPVREGLVGGMEPFIDTIVVCTFTALIILVDGNLESGSGCCFRQRFRKRFRARPAGVTRIRVSPPVSGAIRSRFLWWSRPGRTGHWPERTQSHGRNRLQRTRAS